MIHKTSGIVLGHIKYRDSSIIAQILTREFGHQAFIVNGVRSSRGRSSIAYFQPFTILDLVIYLKESREIQRISEYKPVLTWHQTAVQSQAVLMFLAEVMTKLMGQDKSPNTELYEEVVVHLLAYNKDNSDPDFHIRFILSLLPFLGFTIESGASLFQNMNEVSDQEEIIRFLDFLISDNTGIAAVNGEIRRHTLEIMIRYLQFHVPGFGDVKSLKVLTQIFR